MWGGEFDVAPKMHLQQKYLVDMGDIMLIHNLMWPKGLTKLYIIRGWMIIGAGRVENWLGQKHLPFRKEWDGKCPLPLVKLQRQIYQISNT